MSGNWSRQIEQRYSLHLPEDARAWFDEETWQTPGGAEFCQPQTPEQLMDPEPGVVWAGFMMPDTLPLVGNGYGDWLCLRVAADGSVNEVLHWSHCGGDWLPYGQSLAEALLYDAAARVLFPRRPEFTDPEPPEEQAFRFAEWARNWVLNNAQPLDRFWQTNDQQGNVNKQIIHTLASNNVAKFAMHRDRLEHLLTSPFRIASDATAAEQLDVPWEPTFVRWLFDTSRIPAEDKARLTTHFDSSDETFFDQDWIAAEQEANAVIKARSDLGWAFDIAGWQAERKHEPKLAAEYYMKGIRTSLFSDDTVRFRTHWFDQGYGKFAASRLAVIRNKLSYEQRSDPYLSVFWENDAVSLKHRLREYWLDLAVSAEQQNEFLQAYRYYYQAGWDMGLPAIVDYWEILEGLRRTANAAGCHALATIAELHLRSL